MHRLGGLGFRRTQGRFTTFLADACRADGQVERARELARRGLDTARTTKGRLGIGWAQRTLGWIALAGGALPEAERRLREALETFTTIGARFEMARTHLDLAELERARGERDAAVRHAAEARALFEAMHVPRYLERAERTAAA